MSIVQIRHIKPDIMKAVDFAENDIYLTICGQVRSDIYDGTKENAPDAGTSKGANR